MSVFVTKGLFYEAGSAGGGDEHNLGYYATVLALQEAHPTAEVGDWAIVGETDTIWIWDDSTLAWVDTDTKGQVTPDMVIIKSSTMPSASLVPVGSEYQYMGVTNANYTHGYIYECVRIPTYTATVAFTAATLSGTTVACSGDDFATFVEEWGSGDITSIVSGTITYDLSGGMWTFVGKDADNATVCSFQLYTEDYEDAGFTFTGTPQDGDVVAFTSTIEEDSVSYAWERVNTQPQPTPEEIGAATSSSTSKVLVSTDWSGNAQTVTVSGVTASNTIIISPAPTSASDYSDAGILCTAQTTNSLTFTCDTTPTNNISVNIIIID